MKNWKSAFYGLHPHLLAWIWSALLLLQMILAFFVFRDPKIRTLDIAGWMIWAMGTVFAIVPIFALRNRGRVPQGRSYILLSLALALIGQHWLLVALAAVGMALIYLDTFRADAACIEKFGEEYARYMQRVPRVNFVAGLLRLLVHPSPESTEV
jgi:protein-S-isoprenylcysteine O-methyltransferase Ste14